MSKSFLKIFEQHSWRNIGTLIASRSERDVARALARPGSCTLEDFAALLSPAAQPHLEEMAQLSRELTRKRFGNTVQLFVPMYVSNECTNICTYCGFSQHNKIPRKTLSLEEVSREVEAIKKLGFDHVLLVSGEARRAVGVDYFESVLKHIRPSFSHISIEVQPLKESEYVRLMESGLRAVLVYQETYSVEGYGEWHPRGKKADFHFRLDTPDRLGRAGMYKIGIGALLGLEDWRIDSWFTALHLAYLRKSYWRTKYSVSFPRLRPAEGITAPKVELTERDVVQLICAFRLFDENLELSLSTRESPRFRDYAMKLGITSMSAGSKTDPGGYAVQANALEQFSTNDERSPAEVVAMIRANGYEPVWKDWDESFDRVAV